MQALVCTSAGHARVCVFECKCVRVYMCVRVCVCVCVCVQYTEADWANITELLAHGIFIIKPASLVSPGGISIIASDNLEDQLEMLVQCLRVLSLAGVECVNGARPHILLDGVRMTADMVSALDALPGFSEPAKLTFKNCEWVEDSYEQLAVEVPRCYTEYVVYGGQLPTVGQVVSICEGAQEPHEGFGGLVLRVATEPEGEQALDVLDNEGVEWVEWGYQPPMFD